MPRIEAIALYELIGRRSSIIAPNAYAGIRPAEARENLLVLMSDDGRQGITNLAQPWSGAPHPDIGWLKDLDPYAVFRWSDGVVMGRAPDYAASLIACPALDVALLDLCAQYEGVPLWRILGAEARASVPAYDSTLYFEDLVDDSSTVESVVRRAGEAVKRGYHALKIKIGRGMRWMPWPDCTERDIEVCLAVRDAVGDEVCLMVDANRGYTGYVDDAVDFLAETARCRFLFAEEMVTEDQVEDLRLAMESRGIAIPLAGGEDATSRAWCEQTWRRCRLDVLQMDMCRTGLIEYLQIAAFARDNGAVVAPHNFGSQLGVYESLHLGRVIPNYLLCECDDSVFSSYVASGYDLYDGCFIMPDTPGLGVSTVDPRSIAA